MATTVDTLDWINTEPIAMGDPNNSTEEHQIPINSYFAANPTEYWAPWSLAAACTAPLIWS
ncbi:hypothetical protein OIO89_00570 (plasmid) [Mycobacterium ulcerans]|nr:hypothetical protein OIO89_00570 [Mycobacterium ulcerans]